MVEWTDDAREYLEGYLRQVSALARRNGDDVDEIVGGLRGHVEEKALTGGVETVGLDLLLEVLGEVGSPGAVMGVDGLRASGFGRPERSNVRDAENSGGSSEIPPDDHIARSRTFFWRFATVARLLIIAWMVFGVLILIAQMML